MFSLPFRRQSQGRTIDAVYGMIVAQARSPAFYRDYGVPDTVDGRIDMIMMHLILVLRRLRAPPDDVRPLCQQIFDRFCQDMDDNFREMGVGDLTVPKEMRRIAEAFYGRAASYDTALDAGDRSTLAGALARNVFGLDQSTPGAERLASYMQEAARQLSGQNPAAGHLQFPSAEQVLISA